MPTVGAGPSCRTCTGAGGRSRWKVTAVSVSWWWWWSCASLGSESCFFATFGGRPMMAATTDCVGTQPRPPSVGLMRNNNGDRGRTVQSIGCDAHHISRAALTVGSGRLRLLRISHPAASATTHVGLTFDAQALSSTGRLRPPALRRSSRWRWRPGPVGRTHRRLEVWRPRPWQQDPL